MRGFCERNCSSKHPSRNSADFPNRIQVSICSEPGPSDTKLSKSSPWSGFFTSAFSIFETYSESKGYREKTSNGRSNGWTSTVKSVMNGVSMRKIQERILGLSKTGNPVINGDIWFLGVCYKISEDDSSDPSHTDGFAAFSEDFSSKIYLTYRKGFAAIRGSKYTSDVNWGCMIRSSQMLVAQALLFHRLGRSWRKPLHEPIDESYIEILHLFGDSEESTFSIHNLVEAGKAYNLAPGSWVGPYAMCRTWENLACQNRVGAELANYSLPMAIYVVSGDEDGERGGAPVLCIYDVSRHCFQLSGGQADRTPILLLVPLVLGLDKINPRYIPLLVATFSFPQSLGILGGRPSSSTYIVGVQNGNAFYLDPHEVQQVVDIRRDNLEADTSSYHCNVIRHVPLDSIDPSLAIGFYCRNQDDFNDFCMRASELADQSNGAPLFTITQTHNSANRTRERDIYGDISGVKEDDSFNTVHGDKPEGFTHEDDWQLL